MAESSPGSSSLPSTKKPKAVESWLPRRYSALVSLWAAFRWKKWGGDRVGLTQSYETKYSRFCSNIAAKSNLGWTQGPSERYYGILTSKGEIKNAYSCASNATETWIVQELDTLHQWWNDSDADDDDDDSMIRWFDDDDDDDHHHHHHDQEEEEKEEEDEEEEEEDDEDDYDEDADEEDEDGYDHDDEEENDDGEDEEEDDMMMLMSMLMSMLSMSIPCWINVDSILIRWWCDVDFDVDVDVDTVCHKPHALHTSLYFMLSEKQISQLHSCGNHRAPDHTFDWCLTTGNPLHKLQLHQVHLRNLRKHGWRNYIQIARATYLDNKTCFMLPFMNWSGASAKIRFKFLMNCLSRGE